jgi:hypothetical protein
MHAGYLYWRSCSAAVGSIGFCQILIFFVVVGCGLSVVIFQKTQCSIIFITVSKLMSNAMEKEKLNSYN